MTESLSPLSERSQLELVSVSELQVLFNKVSPNELLKTKTPVNARHNYRYPLSTPLLSALCGGLNKVSDILRFAEQEYFLVKNVMLLTYIDQPDEIKRVLDTQVTSLKLDKRNTSYLVYKDSGDPVTMQNLPASESRRTVFLSSLEIAREIERRTIEAEGCYLYKGQINMDALIENVTAQYQTLLGNAVREMEPPPYTINRTIQVPVSVLRDGQTITDNIPANVVFDLSDGLIVSRFKHCNWMSLIGKNLKGLLTRNNYTDNIYGAGLKTEIRMGYFELSEVSHILVMPNTIDTETKNS